MDHHFKNLKVYQESYSDYTLKTCIGVKKIHAISNSGNAFSQEKITPFLLRFWDYITGTLLFGAIFCPRNEPILIII